MAAVLIMLKLSQAMRESRNHTPICLLSNTELTGVGDMIAIKTRLSKRQPQANQPASTSCCTTPTVLSKQFACSSKAPQRAIKHQKNHSTNIQAMCYYSGRCQLSMPSCCSTCVHRSGSSLKMYVMGCTSTPLPPICTQESPNSTSGKHTEHHLHPALSASHSNSLIFLPAIIIKPNTNLEQSGVRAMLARSTRTHTAGTQPPTKSN